jgi:hypothetical protein
MDFPQWKKASRTRTSKASSGSLPLTAMRLRSSGSLTTCATPLTRTTSRRFGTMNRRPTLGFSSTFKKGVAAVISHSIRYRERMLVEDFDKTRRIALRRNIHRAGRVGA